MGKYRYRALREALTNLSLMLGLIIVGGIILIVLFGSLWAPYNPYLVDLIVRPHYDFEEEVYIRVPVLPSAEFPLGTDQVGMDILTLILHGARITLVAGVLIASTRVISGLFIGLTAGWFEGKLFDRAVLGLIGVLTSLPMLISGLILVFAIGVGGGLWTFFIALSVIGWTEVAQYIRGEVLVARKMPYMEAARSIGLRELEIAIKHVIPNILPQLFVISFLEVGAVLMLLGELALIGVFIGGGSSLDFSDIMSPPNVVAIPIQPEWGAMIASGFRWFRSNPHIVLAPASAVFLAVLGFNALGEGLRGLFENRGIQTSFIVSKRMLVFIALIFLGMFAIFQITQPVRWFENMAASFKNSELQAHKDQLEKLEGKGSAPGEPLPYAAYIAEQLREYKVRGGVRWSNFYQLNQAVLYESTWIPQLRLFDHNGQNLTIFEYGSDFSYLLKAYGGPGIEMAPITLLHVSPDLQLFAPGVLGDSSFEGQVLLLEEGNAPVGLGPALANRGAAGIVWIAQEGAEVAETSLEWLPRTEDEANRRIPVFRVTRQAGERILSGAGIDLGSAFEEPEELPEAGVQIDELDLDLSLQMQLSLKNPINVEITNVVGYLQGTDAGLGDEMIVFVAACDGLWRSDDEVNLPKKQSKKDCMAPLMIEFARMLDENVMDKKRPILFLIFGGGEFGDVGLTEWLTDRARNYSHLSAPGMTLQPRPSIILQLEDGKDIQGLSVEDSSQDDELLRVFEDAADWGNVAFSQSQENIGLPLWVSPDFFPYQAVLAMDFSNAEAQQTGESFSLVLIRMLREAILTSR